MKTKANQTAPEWPLFIKAPKNPSFSVRLYPITQRKGEATYTVYCLDWTEHGERKRRYRSDLAEAKAEASGIAGAVAGNAPDLAELKLEIRLEISAAVRELRKAGIEKSLPVVISEYIAAQEKLMACGASIVEAAADYADRNAGLRQIRIPDAVKEWLEEEENNKGQRIRSEWAKKLRKNVENRFAASFTGFVSTLDGLEIAKWFSGLKNLQDGPHKGDDLSETTKRNIRDDLASFFRWCQAHRYLSKDADLLEAVPEYQRKSQRTKSIIRPGDLEKLFAAAPDYLIPYLAVRALAGVRESEANLLDWKNVHLDTGWIEITDEVAKQTADQEGVARDIPIQPALKAWLAGHAKKEGPICELADPLQAIPRLARRAKVDLPKNALRHSYITYRAAMLNDVPRVADECGNSPEVIRKWYRVHGAQVRIDAPKWFEIFPPASEQKIVPHPALAGDRQSP